MNSEIMFGDAICCVLSKDRKKETLDMILNEYIPNYEKLSGDYTYPKDRLYYEFETEEEMINYFCTNINEENTFFWNQYENNPNRIMVGAFFTSDGQLVISLTIRANGKIEYDYFKELKEKLQSDVGVISYQVLPEFENGKDFRNKYSSQQ